MITIFTPMILKNESAMIAPDTSMARKTILLGLLLGLYPFGQFVGSPIMGSLSDRFGRNPCC
jgi:MFS family permease